jgi:hypothetical protein
MERDELVNLRKEVARLKKNVITQNNEHIILSEVVIYNPG